MVQQVFMIWSNWNWSKKYTPFGPTDNHLDQSKSNGPSDLVQGILCPTNTSCSPHAYRIQYAVQSGSGYVRRRAFQHIRDGERAGNEC